MGDCDRDAENCERNQDFEVVIVVDPQQEDDRDEEE